MKSSFLQRSALVVAALISLQDFAFSAEPFAEYAINGPAASSKKVKSQEAYGLLANRLSTSAARSPNSANPEQETSDQAGKPTFQTASLNRALNMGPPLPTMSDSAANCNDCNTCDCCPDPLWVHRSGVFADLLYLRAGNIDYIYAVEQTGTLPTDSPTGPVGRVGFDGALGYRVGANLCLSNCSSIQASYTWFQDETSDAISANPGTVLIFQPGVPSIPNVGASGIAASADYDIRFQQVDLDYRGLLYGTCDSAVNYFAGLRYANLEQNFRAQEDVGVPAGLTNVTSDINFDGFGIGVGLDGMRRSSYSGLLIYGRGSASFVSGEFKADYRQTTQFGPNSVVGNSLEDFRVLTILQTEVGLGWQSECGRLRVTGGYQVAGWFNSLTTGTYITGVQNRQFDELWETISFDGFVSRVEWRF
jgi:Legionella pneumophila major outer membrane protein precursor